MMQISNLSRCGSLKRIKKRTLIEDYCEEAYHLPVYERILFHLYFRDGHSIVDISQLLMKNRAFVMRRLQAVCAKLTKQMKCPDKVDI